nr:F-box/FBD/LRR-repeat protein At1g13570-like isoform X1 [Ipomoea trifida]
MASCRRGKLEADTRRDVMSELPANVKEMILERLPTHEAARTALLSTHWRDAWLRLGRLVFDSNFFNSVLTIKGYRDDQLGIEDGEALKWLKDLNVDDVQIQNDCLQVLDGI